METNNPNQPTSSSETSIQPIPNSANNQRGYFPIVLGVLILLIVVGGAAYYLGTQKNSSTNINATTQAQPSPTQTYSEPSPTSITPMNNIIEYEHPKAHYTLEYPVSWKGGTEPIPPATKQDYEDFITRSPDYQLSDGYPVLEKGAEFFVRVENSTEKSIDDIFNKDPLASQIANNKTKTTVDGVEAIQYDYSYEGHVATMTEFLKGGKHYTVKYRYVDANNKQSEWNVYLNLLKSFKTK